MIMSASEYEKIRALQEQARRQQLWERMEPLRREVRASNPDKTTEAQAIEMADQFTREAIASLVKKRKIKFAPPAS
jgi:hypothetical protein